MSAPRWELCRSIDGQYFARFIARNGRKIVTSETYHRRADALRAIRIIEDAIGAEYTDGAAVAIRDLTDAKP